MHLTDGSIEARQPLYGAGHAIFMCKVIRQGIGGIQKLCGQVFIGQIIIFPASVFVMDDEYACGIELFQYGPCGIGISVPDTAPVNGGMPVYAALYG